MKFKLLCVCLVLLFIQGCSPGYDRVLFVTRSNVGLDLDTAPPTTKIDISRQEGVIEPSFEDGKTLPVEASFQSKSGGFTNFFYGAGSTFATGEAAVAMTALYDETDASMLTGNATGMGNLHPQKNYVIGGRAKQVGFKEYQGLELQYRPKKKSLFSKTPKDIDLLEEGVVKPVFFGTETSLGLNIKWGEVPSIQPSAIRLGFNRKELAYAPISLRQEGSGPSAKHWVNIPSLLATMEHDVAVKDASSRSTRLDWVQYFATGDAATNLAMRYAVRKAMLKQANPSFSMVDTQLASKQERLQIKNDIIAKFDKKMDTKEKQDAFIKKLKENGLMPEQVSDAGTMKFALAKLASDAPGDSEADTELKKAKLAKINDMI